MLFVDAVWYCCYFLFASVLLLVIVPVVYLLLERQSVSKIHELTEKAKEAGQREKETLCAHMRSSAEDRRLQIFGCIAVIESRCVWKLR
jgi:hypothetical protein